MHYNTSELCDLYGDSIDVLEPIFLHYGSELSFGGAITTVKCFENNASLFEALAINGKGRVLLVDGGASTRRALIDSNIAQLAAENEWEGIICYGAVRDVDTLEDINIGICALASIPVLADSTTQGEIDVPVNFAGVTFIPDDHIYVDSTGIVLSPDALDIE